MNVFTKLRYPTSIRFNTEDLDRLPIIVLMDWWEYAQTNLYAHSNRARIPCIPSRIHAYLNNSTRLDIRKALLEKLNELLQEYEE